MSGRFRDEVIKGLTGVQICLDFELNYGMPKISDNMHSLFIALVSDYPSERKHKRNHVEIH